jgi:hypothetical protein
MGRIEPGDGDPRHGSLNAYNNLRCRCDECREAAREPARQRQEAWRRRQGMGEAKRGRTHGVISNYHEGCRCPDCTEAMRVKQNEYRAEVRTRPTVRRRRVYLRIFERERF